MKVNIIFESKNFAVVEKEAGVVVNRADTTRHFETLQDWADDQFRVKSLELKIDEKNKYIIDGYNKFDEFLDRSGIVHRLDKETSGLILIAKNPQTFINLQKQFKEGQVLKKYVALVHGRVENDGVMNEPIGRLPWNRTRFGVLPEGRVAETEYKVISHYKNGEEELTLLELFPKTGRTHQIRVHMKHLGHPIYADELYAGRKTARSDRKLLNRHFLHASELSILDTDTGERILFESPLPKDLSHLINLFKKYEN